MKKDADITRENSAQQLHEQLQRKLEPLVNFAHRVKNQPGWTGLAQDALAFKSLAEEPLGVVADRIAEFWSLSASLGAYLAQK